MEINRIVRYASIATKVWNKFDVNKQMELSKYFRIRPTNSGITLVSILSEAPMRGRTKICTENKLEDILKNILDNISILSSDDGDTIKRFLTQCLTMKDRKNPNPELEECVQAAMIRAMDCHPDLIRIYNAKVTYVASEFIFDKGKNKIDIIGINEATKNLIFFELKKERKKYSDQLQDYITYYKKNRNILSNILKEYPINSVPHFHDIEGAMVMKEAERDLRVSVLPYDGGKDGFHFGRTH